MAVQVRPVGRNEPCPCGSGRKYKHCHAVAARRMTTKQIVVLVAVSVVLIGGLLMAVAARREPTGQPMGVWSEEHGHYH